MNFDSQASIVDLEHTQHAKRNVIATVRSLPHRQPTPPRVHLVLAGARGRVASALRAQLAREQPILLKRTGIELIVAGAFDRRGALFDAEGIEPLSATQRLSECAPIPAHALSERICTLPGPVVFIDATGSAEWAAEYPHLLRAGIAIATPNKRAHAGSYKDWLVLSAAARAGRSSIHYETTVGAALPIIGTLRSLHQRGERVIGIEGVLSGSLSFILSRVQQGVPLSECVAEAIRLGYTEPDPLEDLGFIDLRRKLLILAREAGQRLESEQIRVESLLPNGCDLAALLSGDCDRAWRSRADAARASGQRLIAVAEWQLAGQARISVRAESADSAFARLAAGENIVRIRSEYHDAIPICISGPGAGPAVTAAGVFSDVLAASRALIVGTPSALEH